MNTKHWIYAFSIVVVGGLTVLVIAGLAGKKYYDDEVAANPLLGLFKK